MSLILPKYLVNGYSKYIVPTCPVELDITHPLYEFIDDAWLLNTKSIASLKQGIKWSYATYNGTPTGYGYKNSPIGTGYNFNANQSGGAQPLTFIETNYTPPINTVWGVLGVATRTVDASNPYNPIMAVLDSRDFDNAVHGVTFDFGNYYDPSTRQYAHLNTRGATSGNNTAFNMFKDGVASISGISASALITGIPSVVAGSLSAVPSHDHTLAIGGIHSSLGDPDGFVGPINFAVVFRGQAPDSLLQEATLKPFSLLQPVKSKLWFFPAVAASGAISGMLSGQDTTSASLVGNGALTGSLSGVDGTTAALKGFANSTGTTAGTDGTVGTLSSLNMVSGTLSGADSSSGTLSGKGSLSGTITGTDSTAGTVAGTVLVSGTLSGSDSSSGTLSNKISGYVTGTVFGSDSTVSTLSGTGNLVGDISGISNLYIRGNGFGHQLTTTGAG